MHRGGLPDGRESIAVSGMRTVMLALLSMMLGCTHAPHGGPIASPEGNCYRFSGQFFRIIGDYPLRPLDTSSVVRIVDIAHPASEVAIPRDARVIRPIRGLRDTVALRRTLDASYWTQTSPSNMTLVWFDGYQGFRLFLAHRGDSLVGTGAQLGAMTNRIPSFQAGGARVRCP